MAGKIKVAILGGGIGGLSAAHELVALGDHFDVHIYEGSDAVGGKAKSQFLPGTGAGGRRDLPGEHGFRFFPAWYRHIPDTMRRIPRPQGGTVADNLVGCSEMAMAEAESKRIYRFKRHRPESASRAFDMFFALMQCFADANVSSFDLARFALKMFDFMVTCDERRRDLHENVSFFDYVEGPLYSTRFQQYLNSSRFMVAMDARRGSACTIGNKVLQMVLDFARPLGDNDRVLNGPTTTQWLEPWAKHLQARGVTIHLGRPVMRLDVDVEARRVASARVAGEASPVNADYFIASLPVERMQALISDELGALDAALHRLRRARDMTASMVGAQFFLRKDIWICDGHVAYPSSPWALSSISQPAFWDRCRGHGERFWDRYGDGSVQGLLSVDVSDWRTPAPRLGKTAQQCTSADEVLAEVWAQLKEALNGREGVILRDEDLLRSYLDADITFEGGRAQNASPLLVHPPGSWHDRPTAALGGVKNLLLAADYVQTGTDLATMEGANEAARHAVNVLLEREGRAKTVPVFPMTEDAGPLWRRAKAYDRAWWVGRKRPAPPLGVKPGPYRTGEGPTPEEVERYIREVEERLRALPDDAR